MESRWKVVPLNQVYEFRSGLSKPRSEFGFGYGFLSFKEVFYNFFVPHKLRELVNSTEQERESCSIKRGDVFLTRTSETIEDLGMSCVALKDYESATFNGFTKRLRPKKKTKIVPEYAGYFFRSQEFRREVTAMSSLSTRASLNNEMLGRLKIVLPSFEEQTAIGFILKGFDDKIELNRRMNHTLEQMAQALFKSWFVDFDPVVAKAAGKKPYGMSDEVVALFPDRFVDSELGPIPEGFEVNPLSAFTGIVNGYAFKSKDWKDSGVPVVKIGCIKPGYIDLRETSFVCQRTADERSRFTLAIGDVLIGLTGYPGEVGIVPPTENPPLLNQRVGKFTFEDKMQTNKPFVYFRSRFHDFKNEVESKAHGTAQLNVSTSSILSIKLIDPGDLLVKEYGKLCYPYFEMLLENLGENDTLATLRNILLPKLLSGQIRIKQAETMVSEAV